MLASEPSDRRPRHPARNLAYLNSLIRLQIVELPHGYGVVPELRSTGGHMPGSFYRIRRFVGFLEEQKEGVSVPSIAVIDRLRRKSTGFLVLMESTSPGISRTAQDIG